MISRVARRVRATRKERGWRVVDLASAAGLDSNFLTALENRKAEPGLRYLMLIAKAFGKSLSWLLEPGPDDD